MTQTKFKKQLIFLLALFFAILPASVSFAKNVTSEQKEKNSIEKVFERVQNLGQTIREAQKTEKVKVGKPLQLPLADDSDMRKGNICFQIEKASMQAEEKVITQSANVAAQRLAILQKKEVLAQAIDDKRESRRGAWDENFDERFAALTKNAKTVAQKQAVEDFKNVVRQAITDRRNQIDQATSDFRTGMDTTVTDQKTKIENAVAAYRAAVQTAATAAKSNCTTAKTARDDFKNALEIARKNFEANRASIEKGKERTQTLTAAHMAAIQKANRDFEETIKKAAATLKIALQ